MWPALVLSGRLADSLHRRHHHDVHVDLELLPRSEHGGWCHISVLCLLLTVIDFCLFEALVCQNTDRQK